MLIPKLLLVVVRVLLAAFAIRRFGRAAGGAVAGTPMIASPPIAAVLLL